MNNNWNRRKNTTAGVGCCRERIIPRVGYRRPLRRHRLCCGWIFRRCPCLGGTRNRKCWSVRCTMPVCCNRKWWCCTVRPVWANRPWWWKPSRPSWRVGPFCFVRPNTTPPRPIPKSCHRSSWPLDGSSTMCNDDTPTYSSKFDKYSNKMGTTTFF